MSEIIIFNDTDKTLRIIRTEDSESMIAVLMTVENAVKDLLKVDDELDKKYGLSKMKRGKRDAYNSGVCAALYQIEKMRKGI